MGFLFLDIETFVDKENEISSFIPFEKESKVLVISYNYYEKEFRMEKGKLKEATFLKEWKLGEKELLDTFFKKLKGWVRKDKWFKIVGFNISKFDIPYLYGRMKVHEIAPESELFDVLFHKPCHVDLAQISMSCSENSKKYNEFFASNQKDMNRIFGIPIKEGTGKDVSEFYRKKQYEKIMEYVMSEFTFEQRYICLKNHFLGDHNH